MEDLSKDMMPGKSVSQKMRAMLNKEKQQARQRIIERGIVHFRAGQEFMAALLDTAEHLKLAPGALCRQIVWDHLKSISPPADILTCTKMLYHVKQRHPVFQ